MNEPIVSGAAMPRIESATRLVRPKRGNYYKPPENIQAVTGVTVRRGFMQDCYYGSSEALEASGLLRMAQFPGAPGLPKSSVSYRPCIVKPSSTSWIWVPGFMQVFRRPDGTFRIVFNVPKDELARRTETKNIREKAGDQAAARVLSTLKPRLREFCEELIAIRGLSNAKTCLESPTYRAEFNVSPIVAKDLLYGLSVFQEAADERRLAVSGLTEAKTLLSRLALGRRHEWRDVA